MIIICSRYFTECKNTINYSLIFFLPLFVFTQTEALNQNTGLVHNQNCVFIQFYSLSSKKAKGGVAGSWQEPFKVQDLFAVIFFTARWFLIFYFCSGHQGLYWNYINQLTHTQNTHIRFQEIYHFEGELNIYKLFVLDTFIVFHISFHFLHVDFWIYL